MEPSQLPLYTRSRLLTKKGTHHVASDRTREVSSFSSRAQPAGTTNPSRQSTDLAIERTRLAHERTMMGWIRTSTSLITFGFGVYKFFQFELAKTGTEPVGQVVSPRTFALVLIGSGLIALLLAALNHRRSMRTDLAGALGQLAQRNQHRSRNVPQLAGEFVGLAHIEP